MLHRYVISFPSCLVCSSHSNCSSCATRWQEDLSAHPDLESVRITTDPLTIELQSPLPGEELEDFLDDRGILLTNF